MRITLPQIYLFAEASPTSRKLVEGERLLNSKHIIFCGRENEVEPGKTEHNLIAFCLQTSNLRGAPHEIRGIIDNDTIESMSCSCKAGLSEKCKHIVAVLLYCNRNDIDDLSVMSCTDKKCAWNKPHKESLEQYHPAPLDEHECLKNEATSDRTVNISEEEANIIRQILINKNPTSALALHTCGRHTPLLGMNNNIVHNDEFSTTDLKYLIENQASDLMKELSEIVYQPLRDCCSNILNRLKGDPYSICVRTKDSREDWRNERQLRVTGSRIYELYTYSRNKSADWAQKSLKYFYPKPFFSKYCKHGIQNEQKARTAYEMKMNVKVLECRLIISNQNPWLGYSPNGIVFTDNKPNKLIEIKCPFIGKTTSINEAVQQVKWLEINGENITLKKKHAYYAQIQLGMAILNIKQAD